MRRAVAKSRSRARHRGSVRRRKLLPSELPRETGGGVATAGSRSWDAPLRVRPDRSDRRRAAGRHGGWAGVHLATQTQPLNERVVALLIAALQIVEQAPTLAHHHEQAAARMEILGMA